MRSSTNSTLPFQLVTARLQPPMGQQQRTARPDNPLVASASANSMGVKIERPKIIENNRNNIIANFTMNGDLLAGSSVKLGGNLVQRWHVQSRYLHQNRYSHSGDGET